MLFSKGQWSTYASGGAESMNSASAAATTAKDSPVYASSSLAAKITRKMASGGAKAMRSQAYAPAQNTDRFSPLTICRCFDAELRSHTRNADADAERHASPSSAHSDTTRCISIACSIFCSDVVGIGWLIETSVAFGESGCRALNTASWKDARDAGNAWYAVGDTMTV